MLDPPANGKIQGLFKSFQCFSSTFQGKFNFQGLLKTVLYIQGLFKLMQTLEYLVVSLRTTEQIRSTGESRKFEVLVTGGFISNYQLFEL